ncbi:MULTISPECIES: hypothetical protein [Nostoc]|uniref:Uncharacterized protein n=1 Tax=Nostoc paludosum FACHB-159 TaxID=2692908 RepID=A0ABR8KFJ9_9NOSO|nr:MULTISPECIES: hypothetical protein [Nostoc]MBD2681025.1 hypothetical protein [Nostoc sp. FACHB-857]MBD2737499.1 hypothetical protein [Nostoc paludosum FACHB-159]
MGIEDFEFLIEGFIAAARGGAYSLFLWRSSKIIYDLKSQIATVNIGKVVFALFVPS